MPYDDNGIERYKEGVDSDEKYLPSKLQDVTKQAHGLPFSPTAQTAKNTGLTVKCCHCKKPRLLYSPKKLKENSLRKLKKMLNDVLYVCGTSFREYEEEPVAYSRENIHCSTNIETPYYSIENIRKICICCGKLRKEMQEEMPDFYPQCTACTGPKIVNRKRKLVTEGNLKASKKKKQQTYFPLTLDSH